MAKSKDQKSQLLEKYKAVLVENTGYIMVDSDKLDSKTLSELKKQLKEVGASFSVVKNTVFKIALQETNQPIETQDFEGSTAVIAFNEDPAGAAKLVKKIQKDRELLSPRYGIVEGKYINNSKIMELADIPSKEVLIAKLLGSMNAPLSGFMNAVTGNVKGFTRILQTLSEK